MTRGYGTLRSCFPLLKSHTWSVLQCSQFSDLLNLLVSIMSRLTQLGENTPARIHSTRLKDRILSQISALEEHKQGHDVFFWAFKNDLANVLQNARKEDSAEEAMHLAKAASIACKKHKLTNLTDLLKRIARWTPFHHHWYLSSIWFFMVLTLRSQVSSCSYHLLVATVQQLPTRAALVEHCLLSVLHIRLVTAGPSPVLPSPWEGGWTSYEGIWKSLWTTLPDVTKLCQELIRCRWEKGCQGR